MNELITEVGTVQVKTVLTNVFTTQTIDQYKTTTASGSVNAYTIPNSDFGSYQTNEKWLIDFTGVTTNTGACTLNRNGYGAISIKMPDGTNPPSGTLSGRMQLSYNGTVFYIVGGAGSGGGSVSFANFGSSPNSAGGSASGSTITLQPADATNPGGVSTTTQTFAGAKTFSDSLTAGANINLAQNSSGISGSNADLNSHPSTNIRLTNGSLVSLASINSTGSVTGDQLWLHNDTGNAITIVNNGSPPAGSSKIETSFGANISIPNQGSIILEFDSTDNAWRLVSNVGPASSSFPGYLTSADWSTFNGKQSAITFGTGVQTALGNSLNASGGLLSYNGLGSGWPTALSGTYPGILNQSVTISSNTFTLDFNSYYQSIFYNTTAVTANFTVAFSNATNAISFEFKFKINGTDLTMTCPSTWTMLANDSNWNSSTQVYTFTGALTNLFYNITGTYNIGRAKWEIVVSNSDFR